MTFTILGRDEDTGELGIGIATYSLAVGATCPLVISGIAVTTSQASTNPEINEQIMKLIEGRKSPAEAFNQALKKDAHPEFRQVALLGSKGEAIVHSGVKIKPVSGHLQGATCIAIGNFLSNEEVLPAMIDSFEKRRHGTQLGERLISALESGKSAGGQSSIDGEPLTERSAALTIAAPDQQFPIDIRIDVSDDAIPELRHAFIRYREMHDFYLRRAANPIDLPSQDEWERQQLTV